MRSFFPSVRIRVYDKNLAVSSVKPKSYFDEGYIWRKSPFKARARPYTSSPFRRAYIKTEVLALGRPLIEHGDAAMAVQWLVEKCRASGEIPVAFCITISRGEKRASLLDFPIPFPTVFVYSSCFQSLSAEI